MPYPPGWLDFSLSRTIRFADQPLPILLRGYEQFGPVFTVRVLHELIVFLIGPEANHYITVSNASNFLWRESHFRDLAALIGDGLLTTDGEFHRRSRQIMLPAFHRQQLEAAVDVMLSEVHHALQPLAKGAQLDMYAWLRRLALRIAMRALFGLDPHSQDARRLDAASLFEQALAFYATPYPMRMLRGPRTPWAKLVSAARKLNHMIYREIAQRRASHQRGDDVLSLLLHATDQDGAALSDSQVRDQVLTLLFAGHDTTTSTVSFMLYELCRNPNVTQRLLAEQDRVLKGQTPTAQHLLGDAMPYLELVLDETLRKYPPAWIGPRRSIDAFELEGVSVPGDAHVNYSSWASHHLPHVFPEPHRFIPERFTAQAKAALPKGAYVPFGGGSRTCIGMRFGQLEVRTLATEIVRHLSFELQPSFQLSIRQMPTISPKRGLPLTVEAR